MLLSPHCLLAQPGPSDSEEEDSTVTYHADYFEQFAPVSVNDMLQRIPGIELALSNNRGGFEFADQAGRGLGASSQILIDGKRLAGKVNEAASLLGRIAAAEVDYIEIIRGNSSALDVQNVGQMINIVLKQAQSRSSLAAEVGVRYYQDRTLAPEATLSITGRRRSLNYLISVSAKPAYQVEDSFELSLKPGLSLNEIVELERIRDQTNYSFNSNLSYDLNSRDRIAFNALYAKSNSPSSLSRTIVDYSLEAPSVSFERERTPSASSNWEVGGDYQHTFANSAKYKFLFIINDKTGNTTRERFEITTPGDTGHKNLFLDSSSRYREKIVRTSYTWNLAPDQGLELGVEVAQTTQDSALRLGLPPASSDSLQFGGLTPVPLPNAVSTVEEIRYEGFAVHNWRINPRMSLASSMVAEFSEIEQTGDIYNKRDFDFLKPKIDFRFDISNSFQIRFSAEKVVAQLSFADFSAATNTRDEDQDTIAGNPELVQEESWRYILNLDYRLPNDGGVLSSRLFYYDFDNAIGRIDISKSSTELASTNGNVGSGAVLGLNLDASFRFGFIGLPQALLTAGLLLQDSAIDDPLIGFERTVVPYDRGSFRLGFRHDLAAYQMNYGFNYNDRIDGNRTLFDIDNVLFLGSGSNLMLFVEKTGFAGLTYRFEAINVLDHESKRERRRYAGYLRDGVLSEIERFKITDGVRLTFKVRGTF